MDFAHYILLLNITYGRNKYAEQIYIYEVDKLNKSGILTKSGRIGEAIL